MIEPNLSELEGQLGLTFANPRLLEQAFCHRSFVHEKPDLAMASNERLEFLGDAVLGFLAAEYLYAAYPELSEGELTELRAALVRGETLAQRAKSLGLGEYLRLGRGEEASGGRQRQALLAATFEALLAAILLDRGLEAVRRFLHPFLEPEAQRAIAEQATRDFKSRLQELAQAERRQTPYYRTLAAQGPDHDRLFWVEVLVGGISLATGVGKSKQAAEQEAARHALERWVQEKRAWR